MSCHWCNTNFPSHFSPSKVAADKAGRDGVVRTSFFLVFCGTHFLLPSLPKAKGWCWHFSLSLELEVSQKNSGCIIFGLQEAPIPILLPAAQENTLACLGTAQHYVINPSSFGCHFVTGSAHGSHFVVELTTSSQKPEVSTSSHNWGSSDVSQCCTLTGSGFPRVLFKSDKNCI